MLSDSDYYLQKAQEMRELATHAHDPDAKREIERLAEEYRVLARNAEH